MSTTAAPHMPNPNVRGGMSYFLEPLNAPPPPPLPLNNQMKLLVLVFLPQESSILCCSGCRCTYKATDQTVLCSCSADFSQKTIQTSKSKHICSGK